MIRQDIGMMQSPRRTQGRGQQGRRALWALPIMSPSICREEVTQYRCDWSYLCYIDASWSSSFSVQVILKELPAHWMLSSYSRLAEVLLTGKTSDVKARALWSLMVPVTPTPAPFSSSCSTLLTLDRWRTWPGQLGGGHCHPQMAAVGHTFRGLWNILPLFSLSRQQGTSTSLF